MGLSYNVYLTANKIFGCKGCKTHLADFNDIMSRNFRGQHGKAYLFNKVVNVTQGEPVERNMTTGRHLVRDIACRQCKETVGWKYDKAYESSEKYKEGKFILEEELFCVAVVFHGPYKVAVEQRPIPKVQDPEDVIVKVGYTALCGSELHMFRGVEPAGKDFIMGHEFVGTIVEMGSAVKTLQKGDRVVTAFTTSCGECFYCKQGWSSRCDKNGLFGCDSLDGGQAEYARIPNAEGSVMKAPEGVDEKYLVLMGDIFPTGWFAANNAFKNSTPEQIAEQTVVLIGCGPVGLCALINALEYKPKHILAVDSVPSRLELAKSLGAEPWNFQLDRAGLDKRVQELTNGRGADAVIEVVGLSPALRTGFELLRPWGTISSVGVHNGEIPWDGNDAYSKNLTVQMGRCPVRSVAPQALEVLKRNQHKLGFMTDKIMPLSQAVEGYKLFEAHQVQKVIFQADK
ncbi:Alcohol dehydrogenase superfamily zinc-type [Penicillium psychrosexuale]|uniref:Alcohol dehydrogenase superfamily zinc-type n=1 Tax=Penicillium psychrosexuale TaxID=1002107 RepID=UPI0025458157|nr:Alcohol dehydrogenase superfamily zinc-type [Penicillium psychrosexuale]KAJ5789696.1 Alcohol dehydrogenase superfamily zinc-type [Penicillium psychrosexuale]